MSCAVPNNVALLPGVAIQPKPYCSIDAAVLGGSLERANWIRGWAILQLLSDARAPADFVLPDGAQARRGWWADSVRANAFSTGSLLWTLGYSMASAAAVQQAQLYATQALQPLTDWGVASSIDVAATYANKRKIEIAITIAGPGADAVNLVINGTAAPGMGWLWEEYRT
jgi:phage gp46-like protein